MALALTLALALALTPGQRGERKRSGSEVWANLKRILLHITWQWAAPILGETPRISSRSRPSGLGEVLQGKQLLC